jgi:ABC-type dipeptide/oligopeptide/nickel transport system permease subunit
MIDPVAVLVGLVIGHFVGLVLAFVFGEPIMRAMDWFYNWFPWNRPQP